MRLAVLTPAPDEPRFAAISGRWLGRLAAALALADVAVEGRTWVDPGDLSAFDGVTPLLAWSYFLELDRWAALLDRLRGLGAPVLNPAEVLRWNTDKRYLAELEAKGAPVLPTIFAERLTPELLAEAHRRFGPELVVKPRISGGSHQTLRIREAAALDGGPEGPVMLQPFCPAIVEEGELSMLYFAGRFSHALVKRARAGDFRVQFQHGGEQAAWTASPEALAAADTAMAAAGRPLTYARVDLIRAPDGTLRLMELEAIEPDLYLEYAPDGGAAFAAAVRGVLEQR